MTSVNIHRRALGGIAAASVGAPLLAACSGEDSPTAIDPTTSSAGSSAPTATGSSSASSATPSDQVTGDLLAKTSEIEVGGGRIFPDEEVVVTQPRAGEFKCFTAVCTHQGCFVSSIDDGAIHCDCHGSQFSIEDGSVLQGPATKPLAQEPITVVGEDIALDA